MSQNLNVFFFPFGSGLTTGRFWGSSRVSKQRQDDPDGRDQLGRWVWAEGQARGLYPRHPLHRLDQWQNESQSFVKPRQTEQLQFRDREGQTWIVILEEVARGDHQALVASVHQPEMGR